MLRRVRHDPDDIESRGVEPGANCGDLSIHHRARTRDVRAGVAIRDRCRREARQGRVVVDLLSIENSAMTVRRVLAQADVGGEHQGQALAAHQAQRLRHRAARVLGARAVGILCLRDAKEQHAANSQLRETMGLAQGEIRRHPVMALERRYVVELPAATDDK